MHYWAVNYFLRAWSIKVRKFVLCFFLPYAWIVTLLHTEDNINYISVTYKTACVACTVINWPCQFLVTFFVMYYITCISCLQSGLFIVLWGYYYWRGEMHCENNCERHHFTLLCIVFFYSTDILRKPLGLVPTSSCTKCMTAAVHWEEQGQCADSSASHYHMSC